jgi:hypothetical protein
MAGDDREFGRNQETRARWAFEAILSIERVVAVSGRLQSNPALV